MPLVSNEKFTLSDLAIVSFRLYIFSMLDYTPAMVGFYLVGSGESFCRSHRYEITIMVMTCVLYGFFGNTGMITTISLHKGFNSLHTYDMSNEKEAFGNVSFWEKVKRKPAIYREIMKYVN